MEHKKYAISLVAILIITIAIFAYFFQDKLNDKKGTSSKETKIEKEVSHGVIFPKTECNFENEIQAMNKAIETGEKSVCGCVEIGKAREHCLGMVEDSEYFRSAVEKLDKTYCEKIKNQQMASNCLDIIEEKIKKSEK